MDIKLKVFFWLKHIEANNVNRIFHQHPARSWRFLITIEQVQKVLTCVNTSNAASASLYKCDLRSPFSICTHYNQAVQPQQQGLG